ncbi:MAG: hypothetical protein DID92_2727743820 [Candidatus Nitrotoga sp. SPKER]|nr:MAG: hypothetical protein DID92_2727743820 [Candidatus Nitrotoga sp. SPKER]
MSEPINNSFKEEKFQDPLKTFQREFLALAIAVLVAIVIITAVTPQLLLIL